MRIVYGFDVAGADAEYLALEDKALKAFEEAFVPGKYLVETFPVLRHIPAWFPGATFRRKAEAWKKIFTDMRDVPFDATVERMVRLP